MDDGEPEHGSEKSMFDASGRYIFNKIQEREYIPSYDYMAGHLGTAEAEASLEKSLEQFKSWNARRKFKGAVKAVSGASSNYFALAIDREHEMIVSYVCRLFSSCAPWLETEAGGQGALKFCKITMCSSQQPQLLNSFSMPWQPIGGVRSRRCRAPCAPAGGQAPLPRQLLD